MNTEVMFSSESCEWSTPQALFDVLNAECRFETDVCATPQNAKCGRYWTSADDGLSQQWSGMCWMNPPYGDPEFPCKPNCTKNRCLVRRHHIDTYIPGIADWMTKAFQESRKLGVTVVCLVPARTDTAWWHDFAKSDDPSDPNSNKLFLRGRLKFGGHKNSAPFPSVLVVLGGNSDLRSRLQQRLTAAGMPCA